MEEKKKTEVLLVTGAYRYDNMIQVADSIKLLSDNPDLDVRWLICHSRYNFTGDVEALKKHASDIGIQWTLIPAGLPNHNNYGGEMFNEPLKAMKNMFYQDSDPWVYILDDDNIISPLMADQMKDMTDCADSKGKPVIWMAKNREDGFIDTIRYIFVYGTGMNNHFGRPNEFMPDPSQLLMRYSYISDTLGFFEPCFEYDQMLWYWFMEHFDDVTLPDEWLGIYWENRANANLWQCYHDGITSSKDFAEFDGYVHDENRTKDYVLVIGQRAQADRVVIPQELGPAIYEMVKDYYKKKGYVS